MSVSNLPKEWITPDWPAPSTVKAVMTTRHGGYSQSPYDAMNLGDHVGDDVSMVQKNRDSLKAQLNLSQEPLWLTQVHGIAVANADDQSIQAGLEADAAVAKQQGSVCSIMTADCLPVLFCNKQGTAVGAAHAGWRGLQAGVLEATVKALHCDNADVMAWMGAAIGPDHFEVGAEVREAFISAQADAVDAFKLSNNEKWLANIYQLATLRLQAIGVTKIYGGSECTYSDSTRFFSYRKAHKTGRMASLIWII